ncbi:uncharacterized protein [Haliotis asinina]|uniref:uncharacterized protein n=1 Tax=Haliotis asinina TaxID=109174 RepID=UPI003532631C
MAGYLIRRLICRSEMQRVAELVNKEGWNLSLEYLQTAFVANPSGWWGAEGVDGKIVGCCTVFDFEDNASHAGCLVVDEDYRNQMIGKKLKATLLSKCREKNTSIMALNSTFQEGFKPLHEMQMLTKEKMNVKIPLLLDTKFRVLPVTGALLGRVEEYDARIHPVKRTTFFHKCIIASATSVYIAVDTFSNDVIGYGVLQKANKGWKLGPTYADNDDVGYELFRTLYDEVPEGDDMVVYPYAENHAAIALYGEIGFICQRTFTLMYSKNPLKIPVEKVYSAVGSSFTPM